MSKTKKLIERKDIEIKDQWKLEDIFEGIAEWEKEYKEAEVLSENIIKYEGELSKSGNNLFECLFLRDEIMQKIESLYSYARMKRDEDNSVSENQQLTDRAMSLYTVIVSKMAYIAPEIIKIPNNKINSFYEECKELKRYKHEIAEMLRQKKHTLSPEMEKLLAQTIDIAEGPSNIFTMFNNADITFPTIKDEKGVEVELTKGRYISFMESKNRDVRKRAFKALQSSYEKNKNTIGAMLSSNVKGDIFYARARKYDSCLEGSLDQDNIETNVYDNLISVVGDKLDLLHRYLDTRKKILKVDKLHLYDVYVPLVKKVERHIPYDEAVEKVIKGLDVLGEEYINNVKNAFDSRWVDVHECKGKTSGAYSWGTYNVHPYILLNYQGKINDVFTIAHEMGHSMHSYMTNQKQPYVYSQYKIFVAEVASTVNEILLMNYMLKETQDKKEKAYLLNHYLEEFRGTVFRQVMFAEFEKIIHEQLEKGGALSTDDFCEIYRELNKKYFGKNVVIDKQIDMEWARIPHFYSSFYVYKYATGFSAASSIASQIENNGDVAIKKYLKFLSSGSVDYPLNLLKKTGVDLSKPEPILEALNKFESILKQFEEII